MINVESFAATLLQFAASNLVVATPLALLAWIVQRHLDRPFVAHLLWLVVLVKLVTPPVLSVPVFASGQQLQTLPQGLVPDAALLPAAGGMSALELFVHAWPQVITGIWLAGSVFVFGWSMTQAYRFNRLLRRSSRPAELSVQVRATNIASTLGLAGTPEIFATSANISPMVWWLGGRARVYVPAAMLDTLSHEDLGAILAHEVGHISRGDHIVRWFECAVCVLLWWNPLAWWSRRNLRVCEEICCDAHVLARTCACPDVYAGALVSAMEMLAFPTVRPAGLASRVNGGIIERRIRMILSRKTIAETPRWLRGLVLAGAVLVLPLGLSVAQEEDELEKARQWLESGVNSAYLTEEQAERMLNALERPQFVTAIRFSPGEEATPEQLAELEARVASSERGALEIARNFWQQRLDSGDIDAEGFEVRMREMEAAKASGQLQPIRFGQAGVDVISINPEQFESIRLEQGGVDSVFEAAPGTVRIVRVVEGSDFATGTIDPETGIVDVTVVEGKPAEAGSSE